MNLFLTPASTSFLTQFVLALAISLFLSGRLWRQRTRQLGLLTGFFVLTTLFIGLMFLDTAFLPYHRLLVVYAENTVLALALVFLIQFAYRFPQQFPRHKWESRAALILSLAYFLWEAGFMLYRYILLLGQETVVYRPFFASYWMAFVLLIAPVAFLRQTLAADARSTDAQTVSWLRKLWKPEGKPARGARAFVLVFGILFVLGLFNVLLIFRLPHTVYNAAMSIGILTALWLFATNYTNFMPGGFSVQAKLSILTLTLFLALLGSVGWLIAPPYIATFDPGLADQQTLRFTPNASGGYDVGVAPFHFEAELGEMIQVGIREAERNQQIEFSFPFFGKNYTDLYVSNAGIISLGEPYWLPNMQAATARTPAIFPLLIELDTRPKAGDGGVYVRQTPDQLVVTWYHVPALYQPQALYTFQAVLNTDGSFEFTTNGLPLPISFDPDANPSANPWLRGAVSGRGEPLHTNAADLLTTAQTGGLPLIENFQLAFRRYLHRFMLPLAGAVVGGSLLLMLTLPLLFRFSIIRPLEVLTGGVRQMEAGDLNITLPVQDQDEIGYLTGAFNALAAQLDDLIGNLEARVTERTIQLDAANTQLRAEMDQREAAQGQVMAQQRVLAAAEEREQMGRELHDGLGQVLGYINVQSQAVQTLLADGQTAAAHTNLQQMTQAAQNAQANIRNYILGLRSPAAASDLRQTLEAYLRQFTESHGIQAALSYPADLPYAPFAPAVEEQVLRIVQEALTNVHRHAAATRVEVLFSFTGDQAQVMISDDGVGFQISDCGLPIADDKPQMPGTAGHAVANRKSRIGNHFGLSIMRERAAQVGGSLEVRSAPGQGTRVLLTLPWATSTPDEVDETREMRVLLVDDHPLFLDGLRNLLVARGINVIGLARDGLEAQAQASALRPNLIVMDLEMPRCNGVEATRAIMAELPETRIVMLTVSESESDLFEAIKAGASGYLLKSLEAGEFVKLLASVMRGEAPLPPALAARLVAEWTSPFPAGEGAERGGAGAPAELTPRQWDILQRVAEGMTYKEVGAALYLSEDGVKYHMRRILDLLHLANRKQAVAFARQRGEGETR